MWAVPAVAGLVLLAYLFAKTLAETARICWTSEDYSHGLLLPLVSGFLIYERRTEIRQTWQTASPQSFSWLGLALLLVGLACFVVGSLADIHFIRWFAFFPTVLGVMYLDFGALVTRPFIAPLLLLYMAKPLPDALIPRLFFPLQVFAAKVGAWALELLQVPVYLRGNIIEIPGMELMVEQACSGLRSLLAMLTVACIVVLIMPLSRLSRILVIAVAIITAIVLNVMRVTLTGLLAHFYDPTAATGFFHAFSGLVVFFVGLLVVYGLAFLLQRRDLRPN